MAAAKKEPCEKMMPMSIAVCCAFGAEDSDPIPHQQPDNHNGQSGKCQANANTKPSQPTTTKIAKEFLQNNENMTKMQQKGKKALKTKVT